MNTKCFLLTILCLFSVSGVAFGDRQLEKAEILQILQKLTSQPRKTWISDGTIEANHEEYKAPKITNESTISTEITNAIQEYQNNPDKLELTEELQKMKLDAIPFNVRYRLSNEYTMNSSVVVKYDGERFSWEISANSRTDSVKPGPDLEDNDMTNDFDLAWNAKRRYTWDGQKYTIYSLSGNQAMVDTTGSLPHVVNGPLTAGCIPWGYGLYTYKNLSAAEFSAIEKYVGGQTQLHLTLNNIDGLDMLLVMDTDKDYALVSFVIEGLDTTISTQYAGYRKVAGSWIPMIISIERYDASTNRLLASDIWDFTSFRGNTPSLGSFSVAYEADALIEYRSHVTDKPVMYRYSHMLNTDLLLAERLVFAASEGIQAQNCATASMKYAASQLGKDVTDRQLAKLVSGPNQDTSLHAMKDLALSLGLYCRAVRTDIQTLRNLSGCQVILHIPKKNHFVVLGDIDSEYVWSIDLTKDKFCYRTDINFFGMDWTEGIALLVSDRPIMYGFNDIEDGGLRAITGGAGYTCTNLLQDYDVSYCTYDCDGYYAYYPTRYGCESAESGYCMSSRLLRCAECACILDYNMNCTINGDWSLHYMRACS
ncbi:cysteine peptidase family C39 domain-containing protein [Planctomycetota bacterium]